MNRRGRRGHREGRGSISMKAAKLEIGVRSQEPEGKRKKEGARRSVFTNMRCSRGEKSIKGI